MIAEKTYVLLDAMGIQKYIFQTNRLKIILGASLKLARWQSDCLRFAGNGKIISSAGGNVLASFETEIEEADRFIENCLKARPPGMEIAWAKKQRKDNEDDSKLWQRLQLAIARYKAGDRASDAYGYFSRGYKGLPGCNYCGIRPADGGVKLDEEKSACTECRKLFNTQADMLTGAAGADASCIEKLQNLPSELWGEEAGYPQSLEDLVQYGESREDDLLAVVVVDLNEMGNRIKEGVKEEGFGWLQKFSQKIENDVCISVTEAITSIWNNEETSSLFRFEMKNIKGLRINPLVAAGDDLVFALPARLWQPFVAELLQDLSKRGHAACAGIVVAKHTFPVNRLVLMAEELTANAKAHVRHLKQIGEEAQEYPGVSLDWHVHQETAFSSPLEARRRTFFRELKTSGEFHLATSRPYTLRDFYKLRADTEAWSAKQALTGTKMFTLRESVMAGPEKTRDVLIYVYLRGENNELTVYDPLWREIEKSQNNEFPLWSSENFGKRKLYTSRIVDLLELVDMKEGMKRSSENG
jgi:hypothetical protein